VTTGEYKSAEKNGGNKTDPGEPVDLSEKKTAVPKLLEKSGKTCKDQYPGD
jgi:hypothetical protein